MRPKVRLTSVIAPPVTATTLVALARLVMFLGTSVLVKVVQAGTGVGVAVGIGVC